VFIVVDIFVLNEPNMMKATPIKIPTITSVTINTKQTTRKPADQREHARKMVSPPDHLDFFVGCIAIT
jgi:hypothetical protein